MKVTELHAKILSEYATPHIGLNEEKLANTYNLPIQKIKEIIDDLCKMNLLLKEELKSNELGRSDIFTSEMYVITYHGKKLFN